ncbi:MAG: hypothetical protein ACP5Q5_04485 [Brevinematia bacterium]
MGKFDVFLKYLGKEDSYSPDEIKSKLELDKQEEMIESTNVEENLSRVDELIEKISTPSSEQKSETNTENVELDREILDIFEKLDSTPPDINQLKENLSIQSYEEEESQSAETKEEGMPTGFEDIVVEHEEIPEEASFKSEENIFQPSQESPIEENIPDFSFEGIEQPEEAAIPEEKIDAPQMDFSMPEEEFKMPESEKELDFSFGEEQKAEEFSFESQAPSSEEFSFEELSPKESEPYSETKETFPSMDEELNFAEISPPEFESKPSFKEPSFEQFGRQSGGSDIEIDQEKALKIRNRINKIKDGELRKKVRYALIDSHLPKELENELVKMLLLNESDDKLRNFIELNLKVEEVAPPVEEEFEMPRERRVIYSEEIKRQKEVEESLKKLSRFTFAGFLLLIFLGFAFWRFLWIPYIVDGVYNKGLKALSRNDTVEAENLFRKAKEMGGVNIKWYNIYARKYMELTNFEAARKKFIEALEYDPVNKITIYNFADYYKTIYPPRYEDALSLYYRLYKKNPNNFEYIDKVAKTFVEWGDKTADYNERVKKYAEADRLYENYLTKNHKFIGGYFRLLDIALRMKKAERIDILFDTIDKINKRAVNETTFTSLAKYYLDEKRYDRAKKVFDKLMPYLTAPEKTNVTRALVQSEAYYEHGRFLTIHLDFKKAIIQLSNSIKLNPKNAKSYNLLGEIYLLDEKGINSKLAAKDMFDNAIKYDPLYYKPYANMGHLYYYNSFNFNDPERAYSQAFYYYKIASSLLKDEKDYLLSYNLGWLYYRYKDYENALNEFSKIYIDETYNPIVSYNMGNIFFKMNKYELAKVQYEKSINYLENIANKISYLNPELTRHQELYTQLARNYNNMGVVYLQLIKYFPRQKNQLEQEALLNFYKAKDSALRVNTIYSYAEYNIKNLLNKAIKNRTPVFDDELLHKTSLKKFIDEYRDQIIKSL